MTSDFPRLCGKKWDAQGYGRFLASGPGPALMLDATRVVLNALSAGHNVVLVVTGPAEFAPAMAQLLPSGVRPVFTHALGVARPDPRVWIEAAKAANVTGSPDSWCIVADAWESFNALKGSDLTGVSRWDATADDSWVEQVRKRLSLPPSRV